MLDGAPLKMHKKTAAQWGGLAYPRNAKKQDIHIKPINTKLLAYRFIDYHQQSNVTPIELQLIDSICS
ncbi:hypothetical protein [Paludibacterium purpuratum]|uniref:hypothetical protein n=1 Tax=Paludibacterium purpuratum TaxID=1144873 RepID=UPI0010607FA0|nr:hypothetical protein [Paludibacterium purpuratum]